MIRHDDESDHRVTWTIVVSDEISESVRHHLAGGEWQRDGRVVKLQLPAAARLLWGVWRCVCG